MYCTGFADPDGFKLHTDGGWLQVYMDGTGGGDRKLRRQKLHPTTMSPLARLRWWRVVLDEAQLVGVRTTLVSQVWYLSFRAYRHAQALFPCSWERRVLLLSSSGLARFLFRSWRSPFLWMHTIPFPHVAGRSLPLAVNAHHTQPCTPHPQTLPLPNRGISLAGFLWGL